MAQSEAFQTAVADSKKLTAKPDNDELLKLYGAQDQTNPLNPPPARTTADPPSAQLSTRSPSVRTSRPRPPPACSTSRQANPFPPPAPHLRNEPPELTRTSPGKQGKAKKNAWQKVVDEGTTPEQAQEQYVALVEELKAKHGYDANKEPEAVGGAA